MRVLFFGDLAASGFGTVTLDLGRHLIELGEDVRFISQNSIDALPEPFASRTVDVRSLMPVINPVSGQLESNEPPDIIKELVRGELQARVATGAEWGDWKPEACMVLADFRAYQLIKMRSDAFASLPTWHYIPVEGVDLPPSWVTEWGSVKPVAMSKFGQAELAKILGYEPPLIYHGVNSDAFYPVSEKPIKIEAPEHPVIELKSKDQCKALWAAWLGVPVARKWMLRTDRHMPRKRYNAMLRALVPVLGDNPDTVMVIHCSAFDQAGYLRDTLSKFPAVMKETKTGAFAWAMFNRPYAQIVVTNHNNLPREALCSLYNAADLYLSTSAEGFGLTIAEALACGVPAVGMDYSAVPEVIGPAGVTVPVSGLVENEYDHWWAAVDEAEFAKRVTFLLTHQTRREELGRKGPKHIRTMFDWADKARQFRDLLHGEAPEQLRAEPVLAEAVA